MLLKEKIALWRDRFYGRQEAFGIKQTYFSKSKGDMITHYVAQYQDRYKSHESRLGISKKDLALGDYFIPLEDKHVEGHIKGFSELLIYLLHPDWTIHFAGLDFDTKHTFDDVMDCYDIVKVAHGFPCYVARSTTKGHHLYMFFDGPIEAKFLTSYIAHIYDEIGMIAQSQNGGKPLPETFPKSMKLEDPYTTGMGIKPPMQGKGMSIDMNCWVDAANRRDVPIGESGENDKQWEFFKQTEKISVKEFKEFLEKAKIPIREVRVSEVRGVVADNVQRTTEYKPPRDGDFMRVIHGCPAMKRFWDGPEEEFTHMARVAAVTWAMQTKNGLDILRERWNHSEAAEKQIRFEISRMERPWRCAAMQLHNLCIKGKDPKFKGGSKTKNGDLVTDYCFKKAVPKQIVNGKVVINPDNVPESEWSDPSPIRLRLELSKVSPTDVMKDIDELSKDDPELGNNITRIYEKILCIANKKSRVEVEKYLKTKKLAKVKELKEISKEAKENRKENAKQEIAASDDNVPYLGFNYAISDKTGGYVVVDYDAEGNTIEKEISQFLIEFKSNVYVHSLIRDDSQTFSGELIIGDKRHDFVITADDYAVNTKLSQALTRCGSLEANVFAYNVDHLRNAIKCFGRRSMRTEHRYEDYGFEDYDKPDLYRSAAWNISADGFSDESDSYVDLSKAGHASHLNLEKISNEKFNELIGVIKNDYLPFQESKLTYTVLAHSLQAVIQAAFIPLSKAPVLWISGLTGCGKTTLAEIAQSFHGNFPRLLSVSGTVKAIEYSSMLFKDALLVLDDYKEGFNRTGIMALIQNLYDRTARVRLRTNLEQAQAPYCRGLVMMTGEDSPSSEASSLARCLLLEAQQVSADPSDPIANASYNRVVKGMKHFSGVTGRFLHYVLNTYGSNDLIAEDYNSTLVEFSKSVAGNQNAARTAQTISANYVSWKLFCEFLKDSMMITQGEYSDYVETHRKNLLSILNVLIKSCKQEQASNIFVETLKELVASGKFRIDGMKNNINDMAETVGFIGDPKNLSVSIYPGIAVSKVKQLLKSRGAPISHSQGAIGKQLRQDDYLLEWSGGRTAVRKANRGVRAYVWYFDSKKLGLGPQGTTKKKEKIEDEECDVVDLATYGGKRH